LSWEPVLVGGRAAEVREVILELADGLAEMHDVNFPEFPSYPGHSEIARVSLDHGYAGLAILYLELWRAEATLGVDGSVMRNRAIRYLDLAIEGCAATGLAESLYEGFTGIAYVIEVFRHVWPDVVSAEATSEIDATLLSLIPTAGSEMRADLVSGGIGLGVYALRKPRSPQTEQILNGVARVLDARWGDGGCPIPAAELDSVFAEMYPDGWYNLGIAHGVAGILLYASRSGLSKLAVRAIAWLLQSRGRSPGTEFPEMITLSGEPLSHYRLAWCNGDLGVAAALTIAGYRLGDATAKEVGYEVARRCCLRTDWTCRHAGICHGSAGISTIFAVLWQLTGDDCFRNASAYWVEQTLNLRAPSGGIAGFESWYPGPNGTNIWPQNPGVMGGAAGIALGLLSTIANVEPLWTEMFLLDLPRKS
jgi:hypothetical protein